MLFISKLSVLYTTLIMGSSLVALNFTTQLLLVHHDWFKALDRTGQVDVVFIDFSKAFDLVCLDILLTKPYKYGVRGVLLD